MWHLFAVEGLEEILGNEKAKLKVTDKYIKKLYKIGSLSANTINKQINGRTDSLGLKDRVNNYEKVVKEIIEEL